MKNEATARQAIDTVGRYEVKCDDCKVTLRTTDVITEAYAGGRCADCREVVPCSYCGLLTRPKSRRRRPVCAACL
jgi:hypothetical protein